MKNLAIVFFVLISILFFYMGSYFNKKVIREHQENYFQTEILNKEVDKIEGFSNGTRISLKNVEKEISFVPKYNKKESCSFTKCVNKGDILYKEKNSIYITVIKKISKDTLIFESFSN